MALTNQPYLPLYVDDWMNNNKLKMCSPAAHGIMISIMCIMHKEITYGKILLKQKFKQTDKQIKNFALQVAKLSAFDFTEIENAFGELINEGVLTIEGDELICPRMVKDFEISEKRAKAGKNGGTTNKNKNFAYTKPEANTEAKEEANIEANTQANAVNVNEYVIVNENEDVITEEGGMGEEDFNTVPSYETFLSYAKEKEPSVVESGVKNKYDAWVSAKWHDGKGKKIKNWKAKLLHTMPYLPKDNRVIPIIGRASQETILKNATGWET